MRRILSDICLPGINADWEGLMTSGRIILSLDTKIFEMHLYRTLQQEIGLKSSMQAEFSILGTKEILVALMHRGIMECSKKN